MKEKGFLVRNKSIFAFLAIEVLALVAFNFGNIGSIFGIVAAVVAVVFFIETCQAEENKKNLLWVLIPVGLLVIVSAFAGFGNFSKGFKTYSNIACFVALPSFFVLGYSLRKSKEVKSQTLFLTVGIALAFASLFGLFSTVIQYGFLYSLIYKAKGTPFYYYNGMTYEVTKEMSWLMGFNFKEVAIEYGSLFAFLSALYLPAVMFVSKEDKRNFRITLAIGIIGVATLVVLPNFKALILAAVVSAFAFIYKYLLNNKKVMKAIGFTFVGIIGIGFIAFIISLALMATGKSLGALDRLFLDNGFMKNANEVMSYMFNSGKESNVFSGLIPTKANNYFVTLNVGFFEFQIIKELGVLGAFILLAFIIGFGYFLYRYIRFSEDNDFSKVIVVLLLLGFFAYETLYNVAVPMIHESTYEPFTRSSVFYVVLFIMGFVFLEPHKKGEDK